MAQAIGVDVGGTSIKAAVVDTLSGELRSERVQAATPAQATPDEVVEIVAALVAELQTGSGELPVGVALPSVVIDGITKSAANIHASWIGHPAAAHFSQALCRPVTLINDADAAGWAESISGSAKGQRGLTVVTTLGTGIGSALIYDDMLIPGSELGHLEIDGHPDYERFASSVARERDGLDYAEWGIRLTRFYQTLEHLLSPSLFVVGGGISSVADQFLHLIDVETPLVAARFHEHAGIVGAAGYALAHREV
ncbi:polyphosphate--glucose phosphotransferase [Pseudoclavibacter soli]|uniref:polyphosphate--glucose phosphotransferase n=1 Tax=Pseudoclavibacter soli TaxID=452623 RepID=UPI0003F6FD57|nr:ROK family protein [Pseudoclavibacter soli]